jgi:nitrite reductase/ring-hydroxylating ferredoxin subunit/uncharacterized membrane protein
MYGPAAAPHKALVHELAAPVQEVIPELPTDVDALWIHSHCREVHVMARLLARIVAAQDVWARPLGDFNNRWLGALFRPIRPVKDLLNGTWLGHPLHSAITDVPIGALVVAIVLDLLDQRVGADVALLATVLFMLAAAVAGAADYADTDGVARVRATLHSTLMVVALIVLVVSLVLRAGGPVDRTVPVALSIVGLLIVTAGAFVGGDVVYVFGNMVSRHAFRGHGAKWVPLDMGDLPDLATIPVATPVKVRAGINDIVLVRVGTTVHALHAVCAHAGGPLAQGTLVDGCLECPWHGSRFQIDTGRVARGPALYDQPAYELREADGGGYEVRRLVT